MSAVEQAIKDAVEKGGWIYLGEHVPYIPEDLKAPGIAQFTLEDGINFLITKEQALLDPAFWQALGKAWGWAIHKTPCGCDECSPSIVDRKTGWNVHWHRLIDHLASGKSVEDFFATL